MWSRVHGTCHKVTGHRYWTARVTEDYCVYVVNKGNKRARGGRRLHKKKSQGSMYVVFKKKRRATATTSSPSSPSPSPSPPSSALAPAPAPAPAPAAPALAPAPAPHPPLPSAWHPTSAGSGRCRTRRRECP